MAKGIRTESTINWFETHKETLTKGRKMVSELVPSIKKAHQDWDDWKCRLYACGRLGLITC